MLDQQYADNIGWMSVAKYRTSEKQRSSQLDEMEMSHGKAADMWDLITTQKKTTPGEKD